MMNENELLPYYRDIMSKKDIYSLAEILDRPAILSIIMISVLMSFLSLCIPIAAQTLINLIAFGKLMKPVVIISLLVFVTMMALGALTIWQIVIVEVIQQKLMVNISFHLTKQFTHLALDNFTTHHRPELANRYFEIITLQKSLANLLLYGINLGLQLVLGLLLLLFYHPLFLVFDLFILVGLGLIIAIPYQRGLESAEAECVQKHQVGAWLEEILINRFLFRFNFYHHYAVQQADKRLVAFLQARNRHFKQLLTHQVGFYTLSALASSLLLGLGGYLVINNQLSLGQLVAAEIVLGALIYAFKRFGTLLENYYDLRTAQERIATVLELPIDEVNDDLTELFTPLRRIEFKLHDGTQAGASLENPLLIYGNDPQVCQNFTNELLGFSSQGSFDILINATFCSQKNRVALRHCTLLVGQPQWFAGTIYDNLLLNQGQLSNKVIMEQLNNMGLVDTIMRQPNGLQTIIYEWPTLFSHVELMRFMLVRALLVKPQLLIIDRALDALNPSIDTIMPQLITLKNTVLIIVSQNNQWHHLTNRLVLPS